MLNKYSNQNHFVNRNRPAMPKTASIYDRQAISNREKEASTLSFSSLAPYEAEAILTIMKKEAEEIDKLELDKKAALLSSPFETFKHAKNLVASKLGISDDPAHDLASSIVGKAQVLHEDIGGEIEPIVGGIIESMDQVDIQDKIGAVPMRKSSPHEIEEHLKMRLTEEMQLSAFQADNVVKSIMVQARNLSTNFRQNDTFQIANAIMDVLINHQDVSVVYNISSSERLTEEVRTQLNNA